MPIERRAITDREQWKQWRRADITASTIGALFGVHPYTTALKLYVEKRGVEFPETDNEVMRRGRWLEPAVIEAVRERRPEWTLEKSNVYLRDPEKRLGATPDYSIHDVRGRGILQAKSCAPFIFERDWSPEEPPRWIVLQTLLEMLLDDAAFGVIACLIDDPFAMDLHLYDVPRNPQDEAAIIEAARKFWLDVEAGREPEADYAKDSDAIRALTAQVTQGKTLDASTLNHLPMLFAEHAYLMAQVKRCEARDEEIKNQVRLAMGDAEKIIGIEGWHVTNKMVERAGYTVQPKASRQLKIYDKRPLHDRPDST